MLFRSVLAQDGADQDQHGYGDIRRSRTTLHHDLLQEEQGRIQPDPDDINEVPVVTDSLERGELTRVTFAAAHAKQQEEHGDESEEHVQTVDAGGDEEDRTVGVGDRKSTRL